MMALRPSNESQVRPDLGEVLVVIHDFQARSSDELSLTKNDRVELIERDDEFGDGWFLGRHLANGNTGLFPEVYTRPAPKPMTNSTFSSSTPLATLPEDTQDSQPTAVSQSHAVPEEPSQPAKPTSSSEEAPVTLPLNAAKSEPLPTTGMNSQGSSSVTQDRLNTPNQDSQVLNDTLNVINEHITNLRSPASNNALRAAATDSGSEYSAPLDSRMSYIQGEETDEEDDTTHTRAEVESWTSDQVAEYLFTSGVESHHCEVFRSQEISGEVILGMDQSSLFISAFDLGSVGRRLKTWHRIKALQDEVNGRGVATRRTTQTYGSDVGSEDIPRTRGRTSTMTNSVSNPPMAIQTRRLSSTHTPPALTPNSVAPPQDSPTQPGHYKRPSAASVRDLHHSRRHSSTDYQMVGATTPKLTSNGTFPGAAEAAHKKQPSFDRNWSMGGAFAQTSSPRPLSSSGNRGGSDPELQDSAVDLDRGYFSGTEADGRSRNVLRKRDSVAHSRNSSYTEEQRVRSATALSRHSRFGSDSYRESAPSAAQRYYGIQSAAHRRTGSTKTTDSARPMPVAKDGPSPTVTKLGTSRDSDRSNRPHTPAKDSDWLSSLVQKPVSKSGAFGIRAISDNLSLGRNKAETSGDSLKDQALASPARTGSSTPSGGPSLDLESSDLGKSPGVVSASNAANRNKGRKGKKETSAYTRGLLKIGPREAMKDADYCGWMKKKSSNLMTTWKPRFFVLKGRRMAYYYSEDDESEKGLIDISFHRVLPADNEKLTGLHATLTAAVGGGSGNHSSLLSSGGDAEHLEKGDDAVFIFKLVPPRAGLSRAVNFTKPTVHYFAVQNLKQGRLWMAALMKATIDRDDTQPITSTYQQKTISLAKAKQMRHRPPALMNLEETAEDEQAGEEKKDSNGLGIFGDETNGGADNAASGDVQKSESAKLNPDFGEKMMAQPPPSA